jgi:hypothetical protein
VTGISDNKSFRYAIPHMYEASLPSVICGSEKRIIYHQERQKQGRIQTSDSCKAEDGRTIISDYSQKPVNYRNVYYMIKSYKEQYLMV